MLGIEITPIDIGKALRVTHHNLFCYQVIVHIAYIDIMTKHIAHDSYLIICRPLYLSRF